MTDSELHLFFEDFVRTLRSRGVVCAITSGLACVHYGVAETTKDCDLLCHTNSFQTLLDLLAETTVSSQPCHYRGNISPPLDARWHRGGWTSHFQWGTQPEVTTLEVFGHALRESSPWTQDVFGLYAGPHTVAEMKRTNRDKDWAFITALGVRMIEADDQRGWFHVFEADTLAELLAQYTCPPEIAARRPAIQLAQYQDRRIAGALNAERKLWEELDRVRIRILERHLRPYVSAVRKARAGKELSLREEHALRIDCAGRHLPENPLKNYGLRRYLDETKASLLESGLVPENALTWLPDVMIYFEWLDV
ncbi:MAG: hypothetical protein HY298_19435 [Verrucomicrobia bacterium]|nr:hypothetical protein [Verrucomicrobiota bacterium]